MGNRGWIRVIPFDEPQHPERVWNFSYHWAGSHLASIVGEAWKRAEQEVMGYRYSIHDLFPLLLGQVTVERDGRCWLGAIGTLSDTPAVFIHLPESAGDDPYVELFDVGADLTRRLRWSGGLHDYLNGDDHLGDDEPQTILDD